MFSASRPLLCKASFQREMEEDEDALPSAPPPPPPSSPPITVTDRSGALLPVTPLHQFADLPGLPSWLGAGLTQLGYPTTTQIQSVTMPLLLEGHDMIGLAPTGSGKTVAFAVPALKMFQRSPRRTPTILVLAPTRELVQQTTKVFTSLGGNNVQVCEAFGGVPREIQARRLQYGCDVLVACPGRLKDFLDSGVVSLEALRFLVFDEADRLLDMGFKPQLDDIMNFMDPDAPRQTMMWSATWPTSVQQLAREFLKEERLTVRAGTAGTGAQVNERIKQHILFAHDNNDKLEQLAQLVESGQIKEDGCKMIIFVERQTETDDVAYQFARRLGIRHDNIQAIHGGLPQRRRDQVMDNFKRNKCRILVATDVAARGLDFPDVTVVVNFVAPKEIDSYCHRIGRTGRAGRSGDAFTFILEGPSNAGLASDLVGYLQKCKMEVPEKLRQIASLFRGGSGNGRNNFHRGGGGGRGRNFGGGGRGGGHRSYGQDRRSYGGQRDDGFGDSSGGSWGQTSGSSFKRAPQGRFSDPFDM